MSRILLADDSQQALRLGEQILTGEGLQVVSVTDGATALRRLHDADPDVLITDVFLPTKNGFELARYIKAQPEQKHVRVVFAAGVADQFDEQDAKNAGAEAILRKPFEASALLAAIRPLLAQAKAEREKQAGSQGRFERSTIRAAVTLAIDSAMPVMIEEMTERVMLALSQQRVPVPAASTTGAERKSASAPAESAPTAEPASQAIGDQR
ncbi:MAG TPA: response regulator [Bryobacteraceae bacterium]|jgi:CheY-like chemotaxis protein|nr:response regulator [Bryobacteraceae bacterium]